MTNKKNYRHIFNEHNKLSDHHHEQFIFGSYTKQQGITMMYKI
jgi:hypothetical protein